MPVDYFEFKALRMKHGITTDQMYWPEEKLRLFDKNNKQIGELDPDNFDSAEQLFNAALLLL
jgi:hypothetical protein